MKLTPHELRLWALACMVGMLGAAFLGYAVLPTLGPTSPGAGALDVVTGANIGLCAAVFVFFGLWKPEIRARERAKIR